MANGLPSWNGLVVVCGVVLSMSREAMTKHGVLMNVRGLKWRCVETCCLPLLFTAFTGRSGHGLVRSRPSARSIRSTSHEAWIYSKVCWVVPAAVVVRLGQAVMRAL